MIWNRLPKATHAGLDVLSVMMTLPTLIMVKKLS